jgi:hypothetical protein
MGKERFAVASSDLMNSLILCRLLKCCPLVTPVQDQLGGADMRVRSFYLHYRLIREAITATVTVGTALLFGYLIVYARF